MKNFIEVTYEGQKYCVNMRYIFRFTSAPGGAVLHLRENGSFSVLPVQESYEAIKKKITDASKAE